MLEVPDQRRANFSGPASSTYHGSTLGTECVPCRGVEPAIGQQLAGTTP